MAKPPFFTTTKNTYARHSLGHSRNMWLRWNVYGIGLGIRQFVFDLFEPVIASQTYYFSVVIPLLFYFSVGFSFFVSFAQNKKNKYLTCYKKNISFFLMQKTFPKKSQPLINEKNETTTSPSTGEGYFADQVSFWWCCDLSSANIFLEILWRDFFILFFHGKTLIWVLVLSNFL